MMRSDERRNGIFGKPPKKRGNGDLGHLAKREMTLSGPMVINSLVRGLAFSLVAGIVVALLGPFGTFENLPVMWRFAFWISAIVGGYLFHMPLYWLGRFITDSKGWSIWVAIIGSAFVAALPTTILVNGIAVSLLNSSTTDSVFSLYPMVLALSLPLQLIGHLTAFRGEPVQDGNLTPAFETDGLPETEAQPAPVSAPVSPLVSTSVSPPPETSPFFTRLPGRIGKDLLCLQMEDHYVRAFTTLGSEMILMRMADAAKELENVDGMLVHRSFWVARAAVTGWSREGKNLTLRLSNNKNVPVARDRQQHVKAAGWLIGVGD
jgi:LytTr DNA-binding domain